jgi:hypothetical protein
MRCSSLGLALALSAAIGLSLARPQPAAALNILNPVCTVAGAVNGIAGKVCKVAKNGGRVLSAGKKLLGGHVGSAVKALTSTSTSASSAGSKLAFAAGLVVFGSWIAGGAHAALQLVAGVVDRSTRPQLRSTWFSSTYWRVAGIAALLTLPFLFAAAVQALLRSDLSLLMRAGLGYLPLALLAVSIAAPLTMLLLSATDAMSGAVSAAAGNTSTHFLSKLVAAGGVLTALSKSPFLACFLAVLMVAVSVVLWLELLVRDAAIYVVVLMLPLVFSTLVWPARRVWATRTAELLFALVLSKFVVVAVLSLGGAALGSASFFGVAQMSLGLILVGLAATSPWVLMRLLPVTELASSLHGMRSPTQLSGAQGLALESGVGSHQGWAEALPALMRGADDGAGGRTGDSGEELRKFDSAPESSSPPSVAEPHAGPVPDPEPVGMGAAADSGAPAAEPAVTEAPGPSSPSRPPTTEPTNGQPLFLGLEAQLASRAAEPAPPPPAEPPPAPEPAPPVEPDLLPPPEEDRL